MTITDEQIQEWVEDYFIPELREKVTAALSAGVDLSAVNEQQIIRICAKILTGDIRVILDSKALYENLRNII